MTIKGCDISAWQGEIDWLILSTRGLDFAYMRGAYGTTKDSRFEYNWLDSAPVVKRGVYHYFLASQNVKDQFDTVAEQVNGDWGELPPALDLEWSSNDGTANEPARVSNYLLRVVSMLDMLDDASGSFSVVYTRTNFVTTYLKQPAEDTAAFQIWASLGNRLLWLAQYANDPLAGWESPTNVPLPWFDWWMHQFSADNNGMGHYYGCKGSHAIDLDRMREDVEVPIPPPPPPPPPVVQRWRVSVAKLNVRAEPSSTSADLGDLFLNDIVDELERYSIPNELWIRHAAGWSAAEYWGSSYMDAI